MPLSQYMLAKILVTLLMGSELSFIPEALCIWPQVCKFPNAAQRQEATK